MNIPIKTLQKVKDDKQQFELFAVAVLFKINHPNSIVGKVTNKSLRKELHCKHNVAQRILDNMQDCPFFNVNQKSGVVFVPTFKSSDVKTFGRRKKRFDSTSDYCKKIEIREYTLREIKRVLRELLLENAIHTVQGKQVQRLGELAIDKILDCATIAKEYAQPLKQLSSCFGLSRSSASRYIARLERAGIVSKTMIVAERVVSVLNDITAKEWMMSNPGRTLHAWHCRYGWSGWQCYGRIYNIIDRCVSESFKHVIWNHQTRLQGIIPKAGATPDGEAYWAKHR